MKWQIIPDPGANVKIYQMIEQEHSKHKKINSFHLLKTGFTARPTFFFLQWIQSAKWSKAACR